MKKKLNCVLLIDDDEPTNILNMTVIEDAGFTQHIQVMQSAQSALTFLARERKDESCNCQSPDLIFLDINMPAMNGWEFLAKYNELEKAQKSRIIIVMLTTSLNPDDRIKAMENPAISGFESKPITPEKLDKILKKYFPE